jgi:hypothetical protein
MKKKYEFKSKLFCYGAEMLEDIGQLKGAWYFIQVPKTITVQIRKQFLMISRPFGSLGIEASIIQGEYTITWHSSLFYDSKLGAYLLPVKSVIRKKAGAQHGDSLVISLTVLV